MLILLPFPMFIILRENSEVNPNTGGSEDENHAHTAAGKPNAHIGHLSHCIQIDPGSAGRQADYQQGEEVDLHQPSRAPGGEDRQADAVKVHSKKTRPFHGRGKKIFNVLTQRATIKSTIDKDCDRIHRSCPFLKKMPFASALPGSWETYLPRAD